MLTALKNLISNALSFDTKEAQEIQSIRTEYVEKLTDSINNLTDAYNENKKHLYDIFMKVLAIPNLIIITAISNQNIKQIILNDPVSSKFYLITIFSFLLLIICYILSFSAGMELFKTRKDELKKISHNLCNGSSLNSDVQKSINDKIMNYSEFSKFIKFFEKITNVLNIVNVVSFIMFISNLMINIFFK